MYGVVGFGNGLKQIETVVVLVVYVSVENSVSVILLLDSSGEFLQTCCVRIICCRTVEIIVKSLSKYFAMGQSDTSISFSRELEVSNVSSIPYGLVQ